MDGDLGSEIAPTTTIPTLRSAQARADAALHFTKRIHQFAVAQPAATSIHLAWFLTTKSACHALSYDARLIPSEVLRRVAEPVTERTNALAQFLVQNTALDEHHKTQLALPGCYGGMGCDQNP